MSTSRPATATHQDRHEVETLYDMRIPTADPQVTLSADLYLPAGTDPVPALVTIYPYRKDVMGGLGPSLRWFAERGYGCVLVELRGIGSSDGIRRPEFDPGEGDDSIAAIEWASAQPWCDGNVGMWGGSYGAFATLRAAERRPPQLKAIIPMIGPPDPERDVVHPHGARGDLHALTFRGGMMLAQQLLPPLLNYTSVQEQRRWQQRLHHTEPVFMDFVRHGPGDPVWQERAIDVRSITAPALCVGGWQDKNADAIPRIYERIQGPKKLLMGPWGHISPQDSAVEPIDFLSIALGWWDHWLRGVDNGVMDEPAVILYVQGSRPGWRAYESWPPATRELLLATGPDTTLTESISDAPGVTGVIAEYQPDPTTGALSGLWGLVASGTALPLDQHDDDTRALSATSEPLLDDLLIAGRPAVVVRLARRDGMPASAVERLVVRLTEVDPQDRSRFISGGVACPDGPGETHTIMLWPTTYRLHAGHRLRVVLSDSDFPRLTPLVDPPSLRVAGIELAAPTLPNNAGVAFDMPVVDNRESNAAGLSGDRWSITRDPIHDGIEVAIASGFRTGGAYTSQGHLLESHYDIRATVRRASPDAAVSKGTHTFLVRMSTGEQITVKANIRCTQAALWARGEVTIDRVTIFSQIWEASLGQADQSPVTGE